MWGSPRNGALNEAAAWLRQRNWAHAHAWGLGEEARFDGNQDEGVLTLRYGVGPAIDMPLQILGSFNPSLRTFRWAWANKSVDGALTAASQRARDWGQANKVKELAQESLALPFDELTRFVALAAMRSGCDGVYRGVTDDHLSIFMGLTAPTATSEHWPHGSVDAEFERSAIDLVKNWHREAFAVDHEYDRGRRKKDVPDDMDRLLNVKNEVYDRYWLRDDDYWRPCSFGWPSEHDPAQQREIAACPRRAGGCYVVTRGVTYTVTANVVEETAQGLRITDQNIEWGSGLIWPE
jgi:hypothetical protein